MRFAVSFLVCVLGTFGRLGLVHLSENDFQLLARCPA